MEKLELPDGAWAQIRDKNTVTERDSRLINRALMRMLVPSAKLRAGTIAKIGQELTDKDDTVMTQAELATRGSARMAVYATLDDKEIDDLEGYDAVVAAVMTEAWSLPDPITAASVLTLPSRLFTPLAKAAMEEWDRSTDFSIDGLVDDPKVAGASDSVA